MGRLTDLVSAIINADSYKVGHFIQYPEGTEYVSSYIEARSSKYAKLLGPEYNYVEFFGMQMFVKEYLTNPVTQDDIDLAEVLFRMHGEPFNKEGWQYIVDHHNGMLPVEIRALPEGTVLPTGKAMVEIINTDPNCAWLTSYVETAMLRAVWYPTTVATKSRIIKEICRKSLEETCDDVENVLEKFHMDLGPSLGQGNFPAYAGAPNILNFMLHDFGARGASSMESSAIAGAAHLVNFRGTDTIMGIISALAFYYPEYETFLAETPDNHKRAMTRMLLDMEAKGRPLPGFSVEASEHSTMTIKGREGEKEQIKKLIDRAKQGKIVSIVSDSYDYFNNVTNVFGDEFKADIMEVSRNGGRVVIRPDSGDPVEVITKTLEILGEKFKDEITTSKNGEYKVLPPGLRILQGDGIDMDTIDGILKSVQAMGFSVENIVFGMGGGLEQKVNRDDLNFAQKASAARINGVWYDVYKDPKTQSMQFVKQSKKGRLSTIWRDVAFVTKRTADLLRGETDAMLRIFRNGKTYNEQCFDGIIETAEFFTALHRLKPTEPVEKPWARASKHNISMGI